MSFTSETPISVLAIHASGRQQGSTTRQLTADFLKALPGVVQTDGIVERDLLDGIAFVDETWINANFTPPEDRGADANSALAYSDQLVEELEAADVIVIGAPIYNFGVPAVLKAWIDQIARAKRTFQYTADGPVGLLKNKRAIIITASGGTEVGSEIDFATGYLRHVMGFIGITDVSIVAADQQMADPDAAHSRARDNLSAVLSTFKTS